VAFKWLLRFSDADSIGIRWVRVVFWVFLRRFGRRLGWQGAYGDIFERHHRLDSTVASVVKKMGLRNEAKTREVLVGLVFAGFEDSCDRSPGESDLCRQVGFFCQRLLLPTRYPSLVLGC